MQRIGRSVGAVLAGIVVGAVASIGTDELLRAAAVFPPHGRPTGDGHFLLATLYRTIYSVAGGYLTARLAPYGPMGHALVLGVLGLAVCIAGTVATWDKGPEFGPHWYPLALVVLAMPQAWAGGRLRQWQLSGRCS